MAKQKVSTDLRNNVRLPTVENDLAWLKKRLECSPRCIGNDSGAYRLLRVIDVLASLKDDQDCDIKSFKTMNQIRILLVDRRFNDKRSHTARVDHLVKQLFKAHSRSCSPKHLKLFRELVKNLDEKQTEQVMKIAGDIARKIRSHKRIKKQLPRTVDTIILAELITLKMERINEALYSTLKNMAKDDPDLAAIQRPDGLGEEEAFQPDKVKLRKLINKYFLAPCVKFNQVIVKNLELAKLDTMFFDEKALGPEMSLQAAEMRHYFAVGHVCRLLGDFNEQESLVRGIERFIMTFSE